MIWQLPKSSSLRDQPAPSFLLSVLLEKAEAQDDLSRFHIPIAQFQSS